MNKNPLDKLGWGIDKPTRMTITVADGVEATSLGKVKDVPVRFGEATIPISAIVTNATS